MNYLETVSYTPYSRSSSTHKVRNETYGRIPTSGYIPLRSHERYLKEAWQIVIQLYDHGLAQQLDKLLTTLQQAYIVLDSRQQNEYRGVAKWVVDFDQEEQTITLRWIAENFRIGFNLEIEPEESGWYLITTGQLNDSIRYGSLQDQDLLVLTIEILNFIAKH